MPEFGKDIVQLGNIVFGEILWFIASISSGMNIHNIYKRKN